MRHERERGESGRDGRRLDGQDCGQLSKAQGRMEKLQLPDVDFWRYGENKLCDGDSCVSGARGKALCLVDRFWDSLSHS